MRLRQRLRSRPAVALVALAGLAAADLSGTETDGWVGNQLDRVGAPVAVAASPGRGRLPQVGPRPGSPASAEVRVVPAPRRLIVKFEDEVSARSQRQALAAAEVDVARRLAPLGVAVVQADAGETGEALAALKASPGVEYAEQDLLVHAAGVDPDDTLWPTQWGLRLVGAPEAWETERGSSTVVVAVVDTGVDAAHPDLQGALVAGVDLVAGDGDPADENGHGTSAAGVIAARADNALGGAGVCWACSVMPVRVLDARGTGTTSGVAAGIVWAADHGARVISLSLGGPGTTQALTDAVAYAASKGVVLLAAAGNEGSDTPAYPAAYPAVVSVGATNRSDALYEWSNRGPWVRIAAPGCNTAPTVRGGYVEFCGTSSATPFAAGIAALAISRNPLASREQIAAALAAHARPVSGVAEGRVDARSTLAAVGPTAEPVTPPASRTVELARSGRLTRTTTRIPLLVGAGRLSGRLRVSAGRVTLALVDARGRTVVRVRGGSPLDVARVVKAGRYSLRFSGRPGARFSLTSTHVRGS